MPKLKSPRRGSLQFYPRKRAAKILPSVNWAPIYPIAKENGLLGFIAYKVGMASAIVKDNTEHSMTKGKKMVLPVTILEIPNMKLFSIRFFKSGIVLKEVIVSNDSVLKRVLKVPKALKSFESEIPRDYDDIKAIAYSLPSQTSIKKTPDLIELGISAPNKLDFIKSLIGRELSLKDFVKTNLVDIRGLTKGKGLQGPVKRFGIGFRQHKSEKGVRNPGSLGPWHPARVMFVTPIAGQLGLFTRVNYNQNIIFSSSIKEKDINPSSGFRHYGKINSSYMLVKGSVQGPQKRAVLLTLSFRASKPVQKKKYEFQEIVV